MKRVFATLVILSSGVLLAGCPLGGNSKELATLKSEVTTLKHSMGDFQYMGMDPKLSFSIQKADFEPPKDAYAPATVNYTINIKQHNVDFPPDEYFVTATLGVVDSSGNELTTIAMGGKVENGVLSLSDVDDLYGLQGKTTPKDIGKLHLKVDFYSWLPDDNLKPYREAPSQ